MSFLPTVELAETFAPFALFRENLGFIPNLFRAQALLPRVIEAEAKIAATRSELVVLIRQGETIHAQIDIDSHEVGAFDDATVTGVQRVADHLARLYEARVAGA